MEKIAEYKNEQARIQESISLLEEHLKRFSSITVQQQEGLKAGIPFSFIPYLYCPHCNVPLSMENTKIRNGHLYEGDLVCSCGYHAAIAEGIILCEDHEDDTPFKLFNNVDSVHSATDEYSGVYRVLLDKGSLYMYQNMPISDYPQMVMFGPFTCNCLLRFCNNLDKKHTYVVIDPSLKRIKRLQDYLAETELQLIFMAGGIGEIPLRKESIGVVGDYKDAPKSVQNIKIDHPDCPADKLPPGKFKASMQMHGFELQEMKAVGSTHGNEMHFPRNEVGEQVSMLGYTAIRRR